MSPPVVLITAGGTREPIDDVRHIANVASGQLPQHMAEHWLSLGATVHYIAGPGARVPGQVAPQLNVHGLSAAALKQRLQAIAAAASERHARCAAGSLVIHPIDTAADAALKVRSVAATWSPDIAACAMAVADYSPEKTAGKLSSRPNGTAQTLTLELFPTAKVIDEVKRASPSTRLLGFKLLSGATEAQHIAAARLLAERAGAQWVFGNDMVDYRQGIRRGVLRGPDGQPIMSLGGGTSVDVLARALVDAIASLSSGRG
ncbi:MAG: hypothetical protein KC502_10705 [Myxococcales bacterium]|nr:hypothetical protein [Myxococcales bacterium]